MDDIRAELEGAIERYAIQAVTVWDATLNASRARFEAFLALMGDVGLPWRSNGMTYRAVTPDLATRMALSGCYLASVGIESSAPEVRAGKIFDQGALELALHGLRAAGINTLGFFVVGLENDTHVRASATLETARVLDLDFTMVSSAIAYPRTDLHGFVQRVGTCLCDFRRVHLQQRGFVHFETPCFSASERASVLAEAHPWVAANRTRRGRLDRTLGFPSSSTYEENLLWE